MDMEPVVSIIIPCYNGEKHVHRLLDSILAQTYNRLELILVNDGSTDGTERIVLSYKEKLKSKGINLIYIFQQNKGVGSAINAGLKKVTGTYLCWPDYDDYLEPDSVELRLQILEKFPEFAIVTSDAYFRSIDNLNSTLGLVSESFNTNNDPNQFMHLLKGKSIICSGSHMVRTKTFFDTHPYGEIFPSRRGQNYQMLLPVYYRNKRYFLNKPLYNYIRYRTSLSQIEDISFKERIMTYNSQRIIILETLSGMHLSEEEKASYVKIVDGRYSLYNFNLAYKFGDYKLLNLEFINLKRLNQLSFKIILRFVHARLKQIFLSFFSKHQFSTPVG